MSHYEWNRYEANPVYSYSSAYQGTTSTSGGFNGYPSFTFDSSTGLFYNSGNFSSSFYPDGPMLYSGADGQNTHYRYSWASGTQAYLTYKYTSSIDHYVRGAFNTTLVASYDAYIDGQRNADGYWYERGVALPHNSVPNLPFSIEVPDKVDGETTITFNEGSDPDGNSVTTFFELSLNGGGYTSIGSTSSPPFTYDFTGKPAGSAQIRARSFDGSTYSGYAYSNTFDIVHKKVVGWFGEIPIYDPNIGMDGKDQWRTVDKNGIVSCFELVDTSDPIASAFRVGTSNGIKAIAKG